MVINPQPAQTGPITVANTLVAALGTATQKLPVLNAQGVVVGFIPVFNAIA